MAKTIYQRIALEGGKGIADELRKIGKDGEAAFVEIRGAAAKLSKDLGGLGKAVGDLGGSLATVGKRVAIAGAAIGAAVAGTVAFAKAGTDAADAATKQAQALGLATDEYGRLAFAAEQSGVDAGTFATAITRFNQEIGKAADGNKAAVAKFKELGLSIKGANGAIRPTEELLAELANRFQTLPDGAEKSALATELFGRAGARLLPLLNGGADGIRNLGEEATRLGIVFTREQAVIAEGMNDALAALGRGIEGTRFQLGLLFAPAITDGARAFQKVIEDNREAITDFVRNGVEKAEPIVRDLVNAIIGNDADVRNIWVLKAKLEFLRFSYAVENAVKQIIVPAYELIIEAGNRVAAAINAIFGTQFTGQQIIVAAAIAKLIGLFGVLSASVTVVAASFTALGSAFSLVAVVAQSGAFAVLIGLVKGLAAALVGVVGLPALVAAAFVAAGVLVYKFWDEISAGAGVAWEFIKATWGNAVDFFTGIFAPVGAFVSDTFAAIGAAASSAWDTIRTNATNVLDGLKQDFDQKAAVISAGWEAFKVGLGNGWDFLKNGLSGVLDSIKDSFTASFDFIGDTFDSLATRITNIWNRLKSIVSSATSALSSIGSGDSDSSDSGILRRASGGYVSGPGTSTSDSIMARLSDGEFVVRAAAVRKYGPQFLAAINSMRLKMPKFATGGMVSAPRLPKFNMGGLVDSLTHGMSYTMPRFADGGMVAIPAQSQGRPISLTIDGRTFDGLTAPEQVAEDLTRFATNRRMRSAGRKPGWVGG